MENSPKKSKAFIITFIIILLLLLVGYYLYQNRAKVFGTKGSSVVNKIFSPLLGSSKSKIVEPVPDSGENPNKNVEVVTTVDQYGNKIIQAEAGEDISRGDVVYIAGFNASGKPIIMKAIANDKNKSLVLGVAGENISKGSTGNIIIEGQLNNTNTSRKEGTLWAEGNPLYLSDTIYGGMTKNPPKTPSFTVAVGGVIKVDPLSGIIQVGDFVKDSNKGLNTQLLRDSSVDGLGAYWAAVFGADSYKGLVYDVDGEGFDFKGYNTGGGFVFNPITLPNTGGDTGVDTGTGDTGTGKSTDDNSNNGDNKDPNSVENKCLLIEQNPLKFTDDEKARLTTLLRKFYLISSSLKTTDDISTIYNEIAQQENFISQTNKLTAQCYEQVDGKGLMNAGYGWVRHGNPWYSPETGGSFPYTTGNTGYYNQSWSPAGTEINMPAVERVLNIW